MLWGGEGVATSRKEKGVQEEKKKDNYKMARIRPSISDTNGGINTTIQKWGLSD